MKNIGIVGSRRRASPEDAQLVEAAFFQFYQPGDQIVSGGCPTGADRFAEQIAARYQVPIRIFRAEWDRLGRRAGFARNGDIAGLADVLVAAVAGDRTGGTEDTIKKFLRKPAHGELVLV